MVNVLLTIHDMLLCLGAVLGMGTLLVCSSQGWLLIAIWSSDGRDAFVLFGRFSFLSLTADLDLICKATDWSLL